MNFQKSDNDSNTEQGLKRILVNFVGGSIDPQEVFIGPGTTAADLLRELKLDTSILCISKGPTDPIFGNNETLSPQIEEGGLIYVFTRLG